MFDLAPAITEIFLAAVATALLMVGAFRAHEPEAARLVTPLAVMAMVIGITYGLKNGVATCSPSTAESTEMAGVIMLSP